jgi:hypothetical protein
LASVAAAARSTNVISSLDIEGCSSNEAGAYMASIATTYASK